MIKRFNEFILESFKTIDIPNDIKDFISDWKQYTINGITYDFMQLGGTQKNIFVIELNGIGEIGRASLNDYDKNFDGYYLDNIRIEHLYRRNGLATKLYEYIENIIGEKLKPSPIKQSPEIKKYWLSKNK